MTVVLDAKVFYSVVSSKVGLGKTGEVLIVGPTERDNLFAEDIAGRSKSQNGPIPVQFILPTYSGRHPLRVNDPYLPFTMADYPAVLDAWSQVNGELNNAASLMSTHNEENRRISCGYARVPSDVVDWVVIFSQSYGEVTSPINRLRNTVLACIFSIVGVICIICL